MKKEFRHMTAADTALFWSKVSIIHDPYACWIWEGAESHDGYGVFRGQAARTIAWQLGGGVLRRGYRLKTKCLDGSCVRPSHLTYRMMGEVHNEKINIHDEAQRKFCGTSWGVVDGKVMHNNDGAYKPAPGDRRDMGYVMGKFEEWWRDNKPPMKSELPKTDEEALAVEF